MRLSEVVLLTTSLATAPVPTIFYDYVSGLDGGSSIMGLPLAVSHGDGVSLPLWDCPTAGSVLFEASGRAKSRAAAGGVPARRGQRATRSAACCLGVTTGP